MSFSSQSPVRKERGYVLLTLMLFVALLAIGSLALVQNIEPQIKRDREEELIHRGVQYSRAVRHYFKKFGRYPNRIEDLENTNDYRSLRKRYKDPITGKDFKPLHMTDVQMSFAGACRRRSGRGAAAGRVNQRRRPLGMVRRGRMADRRTRIQSRARKIRSRRRPRRSDWSHRDQNSVQPGRPQSVEPACTSQVFGGGAIVGVASTSKDKTIREFNKKDHYNQWQFIYDPTSDRADC